MNFDLDLLSSEVDRSWPSPGDLLQCEISTEISSFVFKTQRSQVVNGRTDGRPDGRTDGQTDGRTDRSRTLGFLLPTGLPHDNGTGPDLSCSSFYF